ncbi:MAG TPA: CSS-motif domain-containing protein [Acidobacteriaceae bacterium]|nr:CSS-motif domain-containing protein [Acidobacteriaceae bacterium]
MVLGGALGAGIALAGARELQIRFSEEGLLRYAQIVLRMGDNAAMETRRAALQFSSDNLPFCSDEELAAMRRFVYNAAFVKDLGREKDGYLYCTSGLGRLEKPAKLPVPTIAVLSPDLAIHANITPQDKLLLAPNSSGIVMVAEGVTAVVNPALLAQVDNPPMRATGLIYDREHQTVARAFGHSIPLPASEVLAQRPVKQDGIYYQPLCSSHFSVCVVAAESRHDMLTFHPGYFVSYLVTASLFSTVGGAVGDSDRGHRAAVLSPAALAGAPSAARGSPAAGDVRLSADRESAIGRDRGCGGAGALDR